MEYCINHPNKKALSVCHSCGKPYCESCLDEGREYYYCRNRKCQAVKESEASTAMLPARIDCPNCSSELQLSEDDRASGKFHCPECEAFLDYTVNPPRVLESKRYTRLFSTRNVGDIALLKSLLDDSEIDYYITGEYFLATYPMVEPARIFVLDEQVQRAKELLKGFSANTLGTDQEADMPE